VQNAQRKDTIVPVQVILATLPDNVAQEILPRLRLVYKDYLALNTLIEEIDRDNGINFAAQRTISDDLTPALNRIGQRYAKVALMVDRINEQYTLISQVMRGMCGTDRSELLVPLMEQIEKEGVQ
jgi:hypothetical protein